MTSLKIPPMEVDPHTNSGLTPCRPVPFSRFPRQEVSGSSKRPLRKPGSPRRRTCRGIAQRVARRSAPRRCDQGFPSVIAGLLLATVGLHSQLDAKPLPGVSQPARSRRSAGSGGSGGTEAFPIERCSDRSVIRRNVAPRDLRSPRDVRRGRVQPRSLRNSVRQPPR